MAAVNIKEVTNVRDLGEIEWIVVGKKGFFLHVNPERAIKSTQKETRSEKNWETWWQRRQGQ